jgi:hypothetical protein
VGFLRAVYSGVMAAFQVPASALEKRFGGPLLLALGTAIAACGYLLAGASLGLPLVLSGVALLTLPLALRLRDAAKRKGLGL